MSFGEQMPKAEQNDQKDERQIEGDIDLIKRGASYEITGMPSDLADELIKEQKGELFPDLATFIKLNKVIGCPKEEFDKEDLKKLSDRKGSICLGRDGKYYYVDGSGNVATFELGWENILKIGTLKNDPNNHYDIIQAELKKNGFQSIDSRADVAFAMQDVVQKYHAKIAQAQINEKRDNFDF